MSRRRDIRPPFEVMKASAGQPPTGVPMSEQTLSVAPKSHTHESGHSSDTGTIRNGGAVGGESWARLRQPLVFRLPPGYAVLIGLGVLLLLIIAFSAGYSQGGSSMAAKYEARAQNEQNIVNRMVQVEQRSDGANSTRQNGSGGANGGVAQTPSQVDVESKGVYDDSSMDPRKPNYQYYIVAHCSKDEAQRLVEFFGERGVEAAAVISHNRPSQYVVFILRPFTREQTGSTEARNLKQKIFEWGKVWASRKYRGPTNLSDTYMAVYHPKED